MPGQTGARALSLVIAPNARTQAADPANVDLLVLNGAPDAGPVDVKIRGVGPVQNDLPSGTFAGDYISVPAGKYVIDVTRQNGVTRLGSFIADLSSQAGRATVIAASGYATPPASADPSLELLAVDSTGVGSLLPATSAFAETSFAVGGPNSATLYDFNGTKQFSVSPFATGIEARPAAADVNGDGVADLIVGAGPGGPSRVVVYDGKTQAILRDFTAFETAFTGGVYVSATDLNGDGLADIVITPDVTGGPRVQVRSGETGQQLIPDFFGIEDTNFRGGARTSFGDLNGDGTPDLIVAAGFGGGPRVAAFNGSTLLPGGSPGRLFGDLFVFEQALRNGAYVTAGDLNNDGYDDLIAGGGPGGGPRVYVLSGAALTGNLSGNPAGTQAPLANFFAGDQNNRDGVRVAAKDLDGDSQVDLVTGLGSPGVAQVRTFLGKNVATPGASANPAVSLELNPLSTAGPGGVFVG